MRCGSDQGQDEPSCGGRNTQHRPTHPVRGKSRSDAQRREELKRSSEKEEEGRRGGPTSIEGLKANNVGGHHFASGLKKVGNVKVVTGHDNTHHLRRVHLNSKDDAGWERLANFFLG